MIMLLKQEAIMVKDALCNLCHLQRSLVEEVEKQPYGEGWVHRRCQELFIKRLKTKR